MLSNIGCFLWHTGQIRGCDLAMKTADEIIKKQPTSVRESAECKALISDIYLVTGILADCTGVSRRGESLEHRQVLLTLREEELASIPPKKVTAEDQIRWGNTKGDLACAYLRRGQFEKTREIMEELLICYKKWGPEDEYPFEYSKYYHHLGHVLMAEGHPDKAVAFSRKGMELEEAHAGGEDSTVLISCYNLACWLFNAGRVQEALDEHHKVLEARIKVRGKNAQFTLESHDAVGILLHLEGRNSEAEQVNDTHLRLPWSTVYCLILTPRTGKSLSAVSIGTIEATGQLKGWLELNIGTQRC